MLEPNIWLIQKDKRKLKKALDNIDKNSVNNYFYTNCISHFNFEEVNMNSKNFNTFLYCEDTNTCIVFMKDSIDEINYTKKYMNENNIQYHEISFKSEHDDIINRFPHSLHDYEKNSKEIWVINNEKELTELIEEDLYIQRKKITYYPLIDSNMILNYSTHSDSECEIKKFLFNGVIVTKNKIILIPKSTKDAEIINFLVKTTMRNVGARYVTVHFNRPKFINNEEKRNQQYESEYLEEKQLLFMK